jgi:hypothetical protein
VAAAGWCKSGRCRKLHSLVGHAAAAQYRHAVDDELVSQQIWELAGGIGALKVAVRVDDQRAMAVVDVQPAVRTTAHGSCCSSQQRQNVVLPIGVLETRLPPVVNCASWVGERHVRPGQGS